MRSTFLAYSTPPLPLRLSKNENTCRTYMFECVVFGHEIWMVLSYIVQDRYIRWANNDRVCFTFENYVQCRQRFAKSRVEKPWQRWGQKFRWCLECDTCYTESYLGYLRQNRMLLKSNSMTNTHTHTDVPFRVYALISFHPHRNRVIGSIFS